MSKQKKEKKERKVFLSTFSKVIVFLSLIYGWVLTTVSYIWAYKGFQPLTDLSSTIVSTIVGPTITYLCSNCIMTIFEKNQLAFSTPLAAIESGTVPSVPQSTEPSIDNPIDLDVLPDDVSFEFGAVSGKGDD